MELESEKLRHNETKTGSALSRFMLRLLTAVIISPIIFCLGVWLTISVFGIRPSSVLTTSQPLLKLYLCPVYFAIAVASYALQSRAILIVASISVAALAPASQQHVRMTRDFQNIDLSAQNAMISGFVVAAACCTLIATITYLRNSNN